MTEEGRTVRTNLFHQAVVPSAPVWAIALYLRCLAKRLEALRCAAAGVALVVSSAFADVSPEKRVALVIGNGAYQHATKLDNATFDARAIADAFRKLGFQVVDGYDLNVEQMKAKISEFSEDLPDARSAASTSSFWTPPVTILSPPRSPETRPGPSWASGA
jgi:Caspase domain